MEKVDKIDDLVNKLGREYIQFSDTINQQVCDQKDVCNKKSYEASVMISKHDTLLSDF